ncbi:MAG TPA: NAD-dependent epimerase/dehydratase family protein [Arthrobacter sp.]|jgi:nucleoside-diphosphate-sugar epimerase
MSRVVIIGATGHVGGYLVPRLAEAGHEVIAVSRGISQPYREHPAWKEVQRLAVDRDVADAEGTFAGRIADLRPDVVIDMLCFTPDSAEQLITALRGRVELLLSCGTIWVHGPGTEVPTREEDAREPFGDYGTRKARIEELLLAESRRPAGLRSSVLHPGHITGPGWAMVNAAGNFDLDVWHRLATGQPVDVPNFGLETVHHVHADDVAQAFQRALDRPQASAGNSYHVVSQRALTLRGLAAAAAAWFGQEAHLRFLPFEEFRSSTSPRNADASFDHISRSPSMSIGKAQQELGYSPRYTSLQAIAEGLRWLISDGRLDVGGRELRTSEA